MRRLLASLFSRERGSGAPAPQSPCAGKDSQAMVSPIPAVAPATRVSDILAISEVDEAEFFVGDLFRRRFATPRVPDYPRHFVAFYRNGAGAPLVPLGYVHFTPWEGCQLGGGMVYDDRRWRSLPAPHRQLIRDAGGVAECLLRGALDRVLPGSVAAWGRVGDHLAEKVDRRVGFIPTGRPHLMVIWGRELTDAEKDEWISRVDALGDF